jgi:cytochrome P450
MSKQDVSFLDLDIRRCPHDVHRTLREQSPVYFDKSTGMYMVLGYDEVRDISADVETFSSVTGLLLVKEGAIQDRINAIFEAEGVVPTNTLVVADAPEHTFQRALVNKAFNAIALKKMDEFIDRTVSRIVGEFIGRGGGDFYRDIAALLPSLIVADQLGLAPEDFAKFRRWTDAVVSEANPDNTEEEQIALTHTICELHRYVSDKADEYLVNPRPCLLSDLVNAELDGRRLTRRELISMFVILIAGSHDTTTSALCSAMNRLATDKAMQQRLRGDHSLIKGFIEEVLRTECPVAGLFRRATRDTVVGGVPIPAGSMLMLRYGAANRDPKTFEDPENFDPERGNASRHLAFGHGPHTCLGNMLARSELNFVVTRMVEGTKDFSLRGGKEAVGWLTDFIVYGPNRISLDAVPA